MTKRINTTAAIIAMSVSFAPNTGANEGNTAVDLSKQEPQIPVSMGAAGTVDMAKKDAAKTTNAAPELNENELFELKLSTDAYKATVQVGEDGKGYAVRKKFTTDELVALGAELAPEFAKLGSLDTQAKMSSEELYIKLSPAFPVRLGIDNEPDVAEFLTRAYDILPPECKSVNPKKPGQFMAVQTAAKLTANDYAKGIVSMGRWMKRNKDVLFAHLYGKVPPVIDQDMKTLSAQFSAIEKVQTYCKDLENTYIACDAEGNILEGVKPLTLVQILLEVKTIMEASLKEKRDHVKEVKEANKKAREQEEEAAQAEGVAEAEGETKVVTEEQK